MPGQLFYNIVSTLDPPMVPQSLSTQVCLVSCFSGSSATVSTLDPPMVPQITQYPGIPGQLF